MSWVKWVTLSSIVASLALLAAVTLDLRAAAVVALMVMAAAFSTLSTWTIPPSPPLKRLEESRIEAVLFVASLIGLLTMAATSSLADHWRGPIGSFTLIVGLVYLGLLGLKLVHGLRTVLRREQ